MSGPNRRNVIASRFLPPGSPAYGTESWEAFRQGLRTIGYADRDIEIESRWAEGRAERLPEFAAELVRLAPEVIVVGSSAAALTAKQATSTIPIVVTAFNDPVGSGHVASFAHPGGNVTGLSTMQEDTVAKEVELLKIAVPGAERIAVLVDPKNPTHAGELRCSKRRRHREPNSCPSRRAIRTRSTAPSRQWRASTPMPSSSWAGPLVMNQRSRITDLAASHKLPAIYYERALVMAGGLMSYGADLKNMSRRAATYVDKILKGAKPADLPVEQPTKFELVVNLKTAAALGLTIPPAILARADEIIE